MKKNLLTFLLFALCFLGCGQNSNTNTNTDINTESETISENQSSDTEEKEEAYLVTFEATTTEGVSFDSSQFADSKLTMLNVWATYCNPCLNEMPDLGAIAASFDSSEFQMIGIISDVWEGDENQLQTAKELITKTTANYPHLLLNESLYTNLIGSISSVPTTFFVNQKGEMLGYVVGAQSKETWEEIIHELLYEMEP